MKILNMLFVVIALISFVGIAQAEEKDPYVGAYTCSGKPVEGCGFYEGTIYPIGGVVVTKDGDRYRWSSVCPHASQEQANAVIDIVDGQAKWKASRMLVADQLELFSTTSAKFDGSTLTVVEDGFAMGDAGNCDLKLKAVCTK